MLRLALAVFVTCGATIASQSPTQTPKGYVIALLAEGKVAAIDVGSGQITAERVASSAARYELNRGRLAYLSGTGEVFAILPDGQWPVLAALDVKSWSLRVVGRVPGDAYPGLAVGPKTKYVYAFGSINSQVVVIDSTDGRVVRTFSDGTGRQSFSGAVSTDERQIFVSYHGNASGVAVFDVSGSEWRQSLMIASHGHFALLDDSVLATTGTPEIIQVDKQGRTTRRIATGLFVNHLMEFALDTKRNLFAVGSCMSSGGFSRSSVRPGAKPETTVLVPPSNQEGRLPLPHYEVCGERISAAPDGAWIVAAPLRHNVMPSSSRPGALLIVDARTGAVLRTIGTSSEVVDVLAIQPAG